MITKKYILTLESSGTEPKEDFKCMCDSFRRQEVYGGGVCRVRSIKPYKEAI